MSLLHIERRKRLISNESQHGQQRIRTCVWQKAVAVAAFEVDKWFGPLGMESYKTVYASLDETDPIIESSGKDVTTTADLSQWQELKQEGDQVQFVDTSGGTLSEAPVLYIDGGDTLAKGNDPSRSRKRQRPVSPMASMQPATVSLSNFQMTWAHGSMNDAVVSDPFSVAHGAQGMPNYWVFLRSLNLSFSFDASHTNSIVTRLREKGYDSVLALSYANADDLVEAGIEGTADQNAIYASAQNLVRTRQYPRPPSLNSSIAVSRWLMLGGIPSERAVKYAAMLQHQGYDDLEQLCDLLHDEAALRVFAPGHRQVVTHFLNELQYPQYARPNTVYAGASVQPIQSYNSEASDEFSSVLFGELLPGATDDFPMSPLTPQPTAQRMTYAQNQAMSNYTRDTNAQSMSFTQMMGSTADLPVSSGVGAPSPGGVSVTQRPVRPSRTMSDLEVRLLYEAVNLKGKVNPCRKNRKVDWSVIATNGMGDPRFTVLAQYTAEELEENYARHHELPAHTTSRNSEWTTELVDLLWEVSQDARCKSGTKTMWEQIAKGRTGVDRYLPLAKFSNSQLRSRYRTEFGDKRPQSRRALKEQKNRRAAASGPI
ncbi:hypothetical protein Poli38472_012483 [Pythium oligandrum]|uniref:Uncharacterized protein n=1 Tax=Pythium oligandrum TaxID=41045 RepID=A0A8K1FPY0_PYTOL|nr:hypothetical protein Poli38472_012483 [Pythium oligandrum]|eukprot:TMW67367.1 hypothetical protein Poli38472_012483 [Pythium oligandrum]